MHVTTRSKEAVDNSQKALKTTTTSYGNKGIPKNQSSSIFPISSSTSKTLLILDSIDYNIIEDMKKTKANISMYEICKLKQQQKLHLNALIIVPTPYFPFVVVINKPSK